MDFETKRELLEYLGKDPNDRKLVDRMIIRGEVYKENWMYHLITNKKTLIDENKELKLRVQELEKSESKQPVELNSWDINKLKEELETANIQWSYYLRMAEAEREDKERRIQKAFRWIKGHVKWANWEEFYEWLMSDEE